MPGSAHRSSASGRLIGLAGMGTGRVFISKHVTMLAIFPGGTDE
jgi:hypothetical protein